MKRYIFAILILLLLCGWSWAETNPYILGQMVSDDSVSYLFESNWDAASGATDEVCSGGCPDTWDSLTDTQADLSVDDTIYHGASGKSLLLDDDATNDATVLIDVIKSLNKIGLIRNPLHPDSYPLASISFL